jgi:hypothetical protein
MEERHPEMGMGQLLLIKHEDKETARDKPVLAVRI